MSRRASDMELADISLVDQFPNLVSVQPAARNDRNFRRRQHSVFVQPAALAVGQDPIEVNRDLERRDRGTWVFQLFEGAMEGGFDARGASQHALRAFKIQSPALQKS